MKQMMFSIGLLLSMATGDLISGKWESKPSEKGTVTTVVFKADYTMEGYINKKPFVSGRYFFNPADSIIAFTDNGCNKSTAVYKVLFSARSDSMRFRVISDTCVERRNGMQRLLLGRKK